MRQPIGRSVALTLGVTTSLLITATAVAAGASADPPAASVVLRGSFGSVAGTDPAAPATAAPDGRALDTWQREAVLELVLEPPLDGATSVAITARQGEDAEAQDLPLVDGRWVTGPAHPGEHVVVVTVERVGLPTTQAAWHLAVPDRPGGIETLLTRPAVEATLTAASGSVTAERGHGCYIEMCQEVGFRPPASSLEPLRVAVGEPLTLELDDGSAIVGWQGRAEPQPGTPSETRLAEATFDDPVGSPELTGLEPDSPGEWLLELRTDYDRERGWQWYLFRLTAE